MYFLDTNALYFYIGREKIGESSNAKVDCECLRTFLDKREDKALASSAYVEAMVKFRNKPEYAEIIHEFMKKKNLQIFNNVQYQGFSPEEISVNLSLKGGMLSQYIKSKVLPQKIDLEVRFAICFFLSILLLYTKYRVDDNKNICPDHDYDIVMFIKDKIINNVDMELRKTLQDAYNNHELFEQQHFKEKYIELLEYGCQLSDTVVELLAMSGPNVSIDKMKEVENEIIRRYTLLRANKSDNYVMENMALQG